MTKKDLEVMVKEHENKAATYFHNENNNSGYFEKGLATALAFIVEHLDELCEETHEDKLMRRATEEAKYCIREYFQDKYGYDDEWSKDEIEDRIQRAIDEGDAETIANSFIDSADDGIPNDDWCETIVRDFYD
jgi:hypothetical protein